MSCNTITRCQVFSNYFYKNKSIFTFNRDKKYKIIILYAVRFGLFITCKRLYAIANRCLGTIHSGEKTHMRAREGREKEGRKFQRHMGHGRGRRGRGEDIKMKSHRLINTRLSRIIELSRDTEPRGGVYRARITNTPSNSLRTYAVHDSPHTYPLT